MRDLSANSATSKPFKAYAGETVALCWPSGKVELQGPVASSVVSPTWARDWFLALGELKPNDAHRARFCEECEALRGLRLNAVTRGRWDVVEFLCHILNPLDKQEE